MKSKIKTPRAATGGHLRQQLDTLMPKIQTIGTKAPQAEPKISRRLRDAIERFRWFICGQFGVRKEAVTDAHVAALVERVIEDFSFMYRHFHGIGGTTCDELAEWAKAIRIAR